VKMVNAEGRRISQKRATDLGSTLTLNCLVRPGTFQGGVSLPEMSVPADTTAKCEVLLLSEHTDGPT